MRLDPNYIKYYGTLTRLLVLGILPFGLLVYLNYNVYTGMKLPTRLGDEHLRESRKSQEHELARVILTIVFIFTFCHILRMLLNIHEMIIIDDIIVCGRNAFSNWVLMFRDLSKVMLVINSSVNMIIYCCLNTKFRHHVVSCTSALPFRSTDPADSNQSINIQLQHANKDVPNAVDA